MTLDAANAFLKTLEEPPSDSFIVLTTSRFDEIIPTIQSRCRKIFMGTRRPSVATSHLELIKDFIAGKDTYRVSLGKDRQKFSLFLADLINFFRDYLVYRTTKDNKYLLSEENYEIITNLRYSGGETLKILEVLCTLHREATSININLAHTIMKGCL